MAQVPSSPSSSSKSRVRIEFAPKPGFCIKTSTLGGAIPSPTPLQPHAQTAEKLPSSLTSVPEGLKVFVNIAWDPKAPPSPKGSEEAILSALEGDDVDVEDAAGLYIPAIVSPAREDKDKGAFMVVASDSFSITPPETFPYSSLHSLFSIDYCMRN
jgi:hypothetical protein